MGKKPTLTPEQARERALRQAARKAKKAARRAITREARAAGIVPDVPGWAGPEKGEYGQDIFDGKVHAKWPSLFKKHLGILESHVKA